MRVPVFPPTGAARVLAAAALFLCGVLTGCRLGTPTFQSSGEATSAPIVIPTAGALLSFPPTIRRLHINVGPNYSPITPPGDDPAAGVLAVEAQLEVASVLRERFARAHADRFFVISAALAGEQHVGFRSLNMYNHKGQSSSLAVAKADRPWSADGKETHIGRGVEFVPVLSLGRLLHAIPADISIPLLKTDTQGFDLAIIKSADRAALRRVDRVLAEVYGINKNYELPDGVVNGLGAWVPHMERMGFLLVNESNPGGGESDALFERVGDA